MEFVEQQKSIWISCLALCSDLNACYGRISELQWLRMEWSAPEENIQSMIDDPSFLRKFSIFMNA